MKRCQPMCRSTADGADDAWSDFAAAEKRQPGYFQKIY